MRGCKFCSECGSTDIKLIYPEEGVGGRHTHTYSCSACNTTWHHRRAGEIDRRLRSKYTIMKDGVPVEAPSFVLVLTDPAARVAAKAYCVATANQQLARDLEGLICRIDAHPELYPEPGTEGILNKGATCVVVDTVEKLEDLKTFEKGRVVLAVWRKTL